MSRVICHLDLDYFYAQVEEVQTPSIKGKPVLVCVFSGRTDASGVVSTANYVARGLGIKSGMPIVTAKRKLEGKDAVIIKMDHPKYEAISERIMQGLGREAELLEQTGIDEAFLDLTKTAGGSYATAEKIGRKMKTTIASQEGLTCSVGIGRSKAVAKLASDSAKPGGLMIVLPDSTAEFLSPLPVSRLVGVGPKTATVLQEKGVETLGQLARIQASELEGPLGRKLARYLTAAASGQDDEPVTPREPTQLGRIVTLKNDTRDPEEVIRQLDSAIEDLCVRLTASGRSFKSLAVIGILADLTTKTKGKSFETPVSDLASIRESTRELFGALTGSIGKDLRRAGLRLSEFTKTEEQSSLSEYVDSDR
ncbi:MAG: DNA polymerase IV [Thaumarchaeota archaeon]|nr:DNA polymerase IV [Nitrososphaerota archaeon]